MTANDAQNKTEVCTLRNVLKTGRHFGLNCLNFLSIVR
jgi:hypothetical protein